MFTPTITTTFKVVGMTCDHCARSVSAEVGQFEGVTEVDVDLATGLVTVTSEDELDVDAIGAAVDEAGYELA